MELDEGLRAEIGRLAEKQGCEVVDLLLMGTRTPKLLQIFLDREPNVTIEDCAALSRALAEAFEARYPEYTGCRLEVSSPGLDRPLRTARDFARNTGRLVRIEWERDGAAVRSDGSVRSVSDGSVTLASRDGTVTVPLAAVRRANIQLKW